MQVTHFGAFDASVLADLVGSNPYLSIPGQNIISASSAIPVGAAPGGLVPATYEITKAGVAALTLAAPIAVLDDGKIILIFSTTAFAHTLTATGLFQAGGAGTDVATFAAFAGCLIGLMAKNGKWIVTISRGVTFS